MRPKAKLGQLLDWVEAGEEIMITRRGKAVARMISADPVRPGAARGCRRPHPRPPARDDPGRDEDQGFDQRGPLLNLVIDASLTMAWYFEDEARRRPTPSRPRDGYRRRGSGLWRLEVANALRPPFDAGIDAVYRDASIAELGLMPITIDADTNSYAWSATLRLAEIFPDTL